MKTILLCPFCNLFHAGALPLQFYHMVVVNGHIQYKILIAPDRKSFNHIINTF